MTNTNCDADLAGTLRVLDNCRLKPPVVEATQPVPHQISCVKHGILAIRIRAAIDIKKVRQRFQLYTEVDGYFISHAGLHPFHDKYALRVHPEIILAQLAEGKVDQCLRAGVSRGGNIRVGGIDWLDWDEFEPIPGMNQICGHTPRPEVRYREGDRSRNFCIDTQLRHYAVIEDGQVTIKTKDRDALIVAQGRHD
jgi:hypothetical protein